MFNLKTVLVAIVLAIVVTVSGTASASTFHRCGIVTRPGFVIGVYKVNTTCKRARLVARGVSNGFTCHRPFGDGGQWVQLCEKGRAIVKLNSMSFRM